MGTMWLALARRLWRRAEDQTPPSATRFESLQDVLRLATAWPSDPSGDVIRRAACELIEAESDRRRSACCRRMLRTLARLQGRQSGGALATGGMDPAIVKQLSDALRRELRSG